MTIAATVKALCEESGIVAYALAGGYASFMGGERNLFPPASISGERRNSIGRCLRMVATYPDNSALIFTWSPSHGSTLKVSESQS